MSPFIINALMYIAVGIPIIYSYIGVSVYLDESQPKYSYNWTKRQWFVAKLLGGPFLWVSLLLLGIVPTTQSLFIKIENFCHTTWAKIWKKLE